MKTKGGEKSEIESLEGGEVFAGDGMWLSEGKHGKLWYRQEEFLIVGSVNCADNREHCHCLRAYTKTKPRRADADCGTARALASFAGTRLSHHEMKCGQITALTTGDAE